MGLLMSEHETTEDLSEVSRPPFGRLVRRTRPNLTFAQAPRIVLPPALQLQLIRLYFQTVHILCPALNEMEVYDCYRQKDEGAHSVTPQELVFQAILFSAFPYLSDEQLVQSPFSSIASGQKALFHLVRNMYHQLEHRHQGDIALVQTALLLSHWSPYDASEEVNVFWADEAFHHATLGRLHEGRTPRDLVVWWCCMVRNRLLALGIRRPYTLRRYKPVRMLTIVDLSGKKPSFRSSLSRARIYAAEIFISLCKLSIVINEVVLLKHHASRWDEWRANEGFLDSADRHLDRIASIDRMLSLWNTSFEQTIAQFDESFMSRYFQVSLHTLRIIST